MAASWLYSVGKEGVRVTPDFMERLRGADKAALRALSAEKLTSLYLKGFTRAPGRDDAVGLFWSDEPDSALIPHVHAGRLSPPPWIKQELLVQTEKAKKNTYYDPKFIKKGQKSLLAFASHTSKRMKPGKETVLARIKGRDVTAWKMMPNPKFDLVVVNRYDRAALLRLLAELPVDSNVEKWLAERTHPIGATVAMVLHADYEAWCEKRGEAAAGKKGFSQALVAAGVVKLTRSGEGERYQLELR